MGVDTFVAAYLIGIMVVLFILSVIAYRKKAERGELEE